MTESESGYPPFSVFCRFLQRESRIACNPVTTVKQKEEVSREDPDNGRKTNGFRRRTHKDKVNAFATESHEIANSNSQNRKERKPEPIPCPLCKAAHDLDVCKQFLKKSLAETNAEANALCLGCLKRGTHETKLPKKTGVQHLQWLPPDFPSQQSCPK